MALWRVISSSRDDWIRESMTPWPDKSRGYVKPTDLLLSVFPRNNCRPLCFPAGDSGTSRGTLRAFRRRSKVLRTCPSHAVDVDVDVHVNVHVHVYARRPRIQVISITAP